MPVNPMPQKGMFIIVRETDAKGRTYDLAPMKVTKVGPGGECHLIGYLGSGEKWEPCFWLTDPGVSWRRADVGEERGR